MIEIQNLSKTFFPKGRNQVKALKNISLSIPDGDVFGIIGMSGAGKSTLVRCINMLERPTEGKVLIDDVDMGELSPKLLRKKRREVTMIFQGFNLLMQRTCLKNITFPLELCGTPKEEAKARALELLKIVDLEDKADAYPAQLSGGQQQRIAIARALATNPKVLLCDEATSALDPKTTHSILDLIRKINQELHITVIIITHQMSVVEEVCNHVAIIDNGEVVEVGKVEEVFSHPKSDAARRLVYPEGTMDNSTFYSPKGKLVRVVFNGTKATEKPFIAQMAMEKEILASIVNASTRNIGNKVYGSILLEVNNEKEVKDTIEFMTANDNVLAEEVK